jgi:hypothetical protein
MNAKLAKRIRQGMRELAQGGTGAIKATYPDDYEGEIQRSGPRILPTIFHHDYIHALGGKLWAVDGLDESGNRQLTPTRFGLRLKRTSPRQVYKRAKRLVA